MSEPLIKINNFNQGYATAYGRGKEPEGSFADSRNLVPTKVGSLEQTHGYSTTGGLAALPTGYQLPAIGSSTYSIAKFLAHPFAYSFEKPAAHDGRVYWMLDNQFSPVNHVGLDNVYVPGDTEGVQFGTGSSNFAALDEIVVLDERKIVDASSADVTSPTAFVLQIANGATHGIVMINNYYKGWRLEFNDSGTIEYNYIQGNTVGGANMSFTLKARIDGAGLNWTFGGAGDTLTLRRWFHRPNDFIADFDTPPGRCFESNGRVRGSGGASSDEDKFPWFMEYLNRTWFTGHANAETYRGTYVDRMEMDEKRPDAGQILSAPTRGDDGTGTDAFTTGNTYYLGHTLEYDGYQESRLSTFYSAGAITAGQDTIDFDLNIPFARLSKRVTAINIYAKEVIAGIESQAYFVKRIDLITDAYTSNFTNWTYIYGTFEAYFQIQGAVRANEAHITGSDWFNRGQTYSQRTGRLEELLHATTPPTADSHRHIISWKEAEVISGRALFGNFYDPNTSQTFVDQIRFTHIASTGVPNYDAIPWERDVFEKDVATGDPGSVRWLAEQNGYLIVFKDDGLYGIYITPTPETWSPQTISLQDGVVSRDSVVKLPNGDLGFADTDHYKILRNGHVIPIVWNWEGDYFNLTKTSIVAWYDKIDRSLRITDQQAVSSEYPIYCAYIDFASVGDGGRLLVPWYKIRVPHKVEFITTERDESVIFTNQTATVVYEWHKTDKTFAGTTIKPYLKTHPKLVSEDSFIAMDAVRLTRYNSGSTGNLQCKLYVDSTTVTTTFATVTGGDLVNDTTFLKVRPTEKRLGRRIQFEYNTHATPETNGSANIIIHEIAFHGRLVKPRKKNLSTAGFPDV